MEEKSVEAKPKKKIYKRWWFWALAVIVLFIIIGSSGKSTPKQSIPATSDKPAEAAKQTSQAQTAPQTLLDISGSGSKSTQKFTAGGDWDLNWSYDCSNFGQQGNFVVSIYDGDGTMSFQNSPVNQLGKSGADVEHYHAAGTYYLQINSECKWKVQVKG